jgi:exoribonuclease R
MVEEMMLLANEAVAAKIFSAFPACALLRNHPVPHPNMLVPLQNLASLFNIPLDTRSNKVQLRAAARAPSHDRALLRRWLPPFLPCRTPTIPSFPRYATHSLFSRKL